MALVVIGNFNSKRPFPFHSIMPKQTACTERSRSGRSYPTSRISPKPQTAGGISPPPLLLSKTAVHHPNHPPFPITRPTNPAPQFQSLCQNQIVEPRTGIGTTRRRVGKRGTSRAKTFPCPKACQRTGLSCLGASGLTNLVFNVQIVNFDAGKPLPVKTSASQE